jgi:hypothetical protein
MNYLIPGFDQDSSQPTSGSLINSKRSRVFNMASALEAKKRKESVLETAASSTGTCTTDESRRKLRLLLVVEPTPFNYVSGYANRFKEMLYYLKKAGDEGEPTFSLTGS